LRPARVIVNHAPAEPDPEADLPLQ
jgi:hypothetical protein